jgi:hypothetical protein
MDQFEFGVDALNKNSYVLQAAISAYSDEAYTEAKKLSGTDLVSSNPNINVDTETFIGQMRWFKPLKPEINVASLTDSADGVTTDYGSEFSTYIKTVRTHGAKRVNLSALVTRVDGLAKVGRDFAATRATDEHSAILSVLKGVAISEALIGAGAAGGAAGLGGQSWENDPESPEHGFYIDMGADPLIAGHSANLQGAIRASSLIDAIGMAWKDYEPEYLYLVTSPETMSELRSANLVDSITVVDGDMDFNTIFNGKIRLIQTRSSTRLATTEMARLGAANTNLSGVPIVGTKLSFLVLPGAIAMEPLTIPEPTEIGRNAAAFKGGGTTDIWFRWGYVAHPAGYDWNGNPGRFPSDLEYTYARHTGQALTPTNPQQLGAFANADVDNLKGSWVRKTASVLSLGILPIFHG